MSDDNLEPYVSQLSIQLVALSLAMREHRADLRWKRIGRKLARANRTFSDFVDSKGARKRIDKAAIKLVALGNEFELLNNLVRDEHKQLALEIINSKISNRD
ncbi:MAG: hypothetical protein RLZZ330_551 [Actinomycetota bacterium]|jgi:hypothetical protein